MVVRFSTKKSVRHYVGLVQSKSEDEYTVSFLRRSGAESFVFPNKEDIAAVDKQDIVFKLQQPVVNNRGQYKFNEQLLFQNIC